VKAARVLTVNVGLPRDVTFGKRRMRTAILKEPTNGAVPLRRLGFEGDGQAVSGGTSETGGADQSGKGGRPGFQGAEHQRCLVENAHTT